MKRILILGLLFLNLFCYSQYCPYLGPDQYLPCGVGSTTLTADLSQCGQGSNPNQTTNYNVTQIPYVAQTNTGNQLFMGDDTQQGPFNIGFTFCYFGNTYTQFWVGSNGWISFSAGQPTTFTSASLPNAGFNIPKNCIMGPWQDWHPGVGGQIRYQVQGVAPCRKLVVSWINVPMFGCTQTLGTFHIVIYESTNFIENHIQSKQFCGWANGTAVQGIHNLPGTLAVTTPGRNSTQWTATNDARRWTPSGPVVTPTLTWFQVGNPNPIGTGPTINVTPPPGGANYTCHFVYPTCNAGWSSCNAVVGSLGPDTVFVSPGPPTLPPPNVIAQDPHCNNGCDGQITITPNGGTGVTTISWTTGPTNFTLTNLCSGNYSFNLIDAAGCTYNGNVTLINPPVLPSPLFTNVDPTCFGYCDGTSTVNPVGGVAPYTYLWSNNQTTQTAVNLCSGQYSVTVYDLYNCPAVGPTTLINPPLVTVSPINGSDTVCVGSNNEVYLVTNQAGYTYTWQTIGNITSGQGTNTINVDWSSESSGFVPGAVLVTAYNQNGCASLPSIFDLTIFSVSPSIDVLGPFCNYDECVNLTAQPIGGTFTINNQLVSQFCPQFNSTSDSVVYTYTQSGCSFYDTTNFIVYPQPFINNILPNNEFYELCLGDSVTQVYSVDANIVGVTDWYILSQNFQGSQITYTWNQPGIYIISATETVNGCTSPLAQTTITIEQCPEDLLYIPNTFTPDGDENNPVWRFYFFGGDEMSFNLFVFNRWGQVIWECHDVNGTWDGTYGGNLVQEGVYVWMADYKLGDNASRKTRYGHVTILR